MRVTERCRRGSWLVVLVAALALPAVAADEVAVEVQGVLERYDRAFEAGDLDAIGQLLSQGPDLYFFLADAGERWSGWKEVRAGLAAGRRGMKSVKVEAQPARVHVRGPVAWFERTLVLNLVEAAGELSLFARATGVLEKGPGGWRIVQYHLSTGAARDGGPKD